LVPASLAPYPNVDAAWAKFETIFPLSVGILDFEPVFRRYIDAVLDAFAKDGVQRIEMRGGLSGNLTYRLDQSEQSATYAIDLWNEAAVARNLSLTFIASAYRGISPAEAAAELRNAQALAKLYPQAVRGFDLVGQVMMTLLDPHCQMLDMRCLVVSLSRVRRALVYHGTGTGGQG